MNLIIDSGNTFVKLAVFANADLIFQQQVSHGDSARQVKAVCDHYPRIKRAIVSSVKKLDPKTLAVLAIFCQVHELDFKSRHPLKNSYATPSSLGMDRLALATAAFYQFPKQNVLVIDAGTCVTYDMVNDIGEYLGGAISPGLVIRYKALHHFTDKLPLLEPKPIMDIIGNSTEAGIHSGVINGLVQEVEGVIGQYQKRFLDLTVILTGGDAQFLSKRLKKPIFAHSNFLLEGLNYLLEYNKL